MNYLVVVLVVIIGLGLAYVGLNPQVTDKVSPVDIFTEDKCLSSLDDVRNLITSKALSSDEGAEITRLINSIEINVDNIVTIDASNNRTICEADFSLDIPFLDTISDQDRANVLRSAKFSFIKKDFSIYETKTKARSWYSIQKSTNQNGQAGEYITVYEGENLSGGLISVSKAFVRYKKGQI